jgi:hypothetical protein
MVVLPSEMRILKAEIRIYAAINAKSPTPKPPNSAISDVCFNHDQAPNLVQRARPIFSI